MKKVTVINIDADKCMGCRACEAACSAYHASPKYSSSNPERSRIRVNYDQLNDIYLPVMGGEYTPAECNARYAVTVDGKKYDECTIEVESRYTNIDSRKIINIKTGEEYLTKEDAAKDLGVSKETITKHLNRRLKQENSHLYLVKWQL